MTPAQPKQAASVALSSLATAVPDTVVTQHVALDWARRKLEGVIPNFARFESAFANAGIKTRHSVCDLVWFEEPKTATQRNEAFLTGATDLYIKAAQSALERAGWAASDVDVVVSVTSSSVATPTLDARTHKTLGLRDGVMRVPVFGLGCAGGVSGLSIARDLAAASPRRVLCVVVETCMVHFRSETAAKADVIATALFGDGAAAVCVSSRPDDIDAAPCLLGQGQQRIWKDTLPIMGWDVRDDGFHVVFDRAIPPFVKSHFPEALGRVLDNMGKTLGDFDRLVCHPGGTKVLEAFEGCLNLPPATLDIEREVLRDFGNMSAPTVLFVLENVLKSAHAGAMLMTALGPGFTSSFLPIEVR